MARWEIQYDYPNVMIKSGQTALMIMSFGWVASFLWPWTTFEVLEWARPQWVRWAGLAMAGIGLAALASLAVVVRRAGTPWAPPKPTVALITTGPFAVLRNPGDVSLLLLGLGWGLFMNSWLILAAMAAWAIVVHFGCIRREEAFFASKFAAEWKVYSSSVRRYGIL